MKKTILASLSISAVLLVGCADTADTEMGSPASVETETSVSNTDPGVAAEPGNTETPENQSVESRYNTLGSASAPSANVPANVATNATSQPQPDTTSTEAPSQNEQGIQVSQEPRTGDDANPDSVQPNP